MWKIKPRRQTALPPLKCKAILLCGSVVFDEGSGQLNLIGLFNEMEVAAIPGRTEQFTIFLLFDGEIVEQQNYELNWEIRNLAEQAVIFPATGIPLEWKDGHMRIDSYIVVPPQQIKHAGDYEVVVHADKQVIARASFTVSLAGQRDGRLEQRND